MQKEERFTKNSLTRLISEKSVKENVLWVAGSNNERQFWTFNHEIYALATLERENFKEGLSETYCRYALILYALILIICPYFN